MRKNFEEANRELDDLEPEFSRAFQESLVEWTDNFSEKLVIGAFIAGGIALLLRRLDPRDLREIFRQKVLPAIRKAVEKGAALTGLTLESTNTLAIRFAEQHAAELVREVTDNTIRGLRAIVARGLHDGLRNEEIARRILATGSLGLTSKQAIAVDNFRQAMEGALIGEVSEAGIENRFRIARTLNTRRAIARGEIDSVVDRYRERMIEHRASVIAAQEAQVALSRGRLLAWQQGIAQGIFDASQDLQEWLVTPDERTCPICLPMHGQRQQIGVPFIAGDGRLVMVPGETHPTCRCVVVLVTAEVQGQPGSPARARTDQRIRELQTA